MTVAERLVKLFDEHAARVAASVGTLHQGIEELVPELAREQLVGVLAQLGAPAPAKPKRIEPPQPAKRSAPTAAPAKLEKKARAKMKCRTCGAEGFRADGCGKTHNLPADEDEEGHELVLKRSAIAPSLGAPLTAITPARPKPLTPAELDKLKTRIRERREREEAQAPKPQRAPTTAPPPQPIVAALPIPIATFTI